MFKKFVFVTGALDILVGIAAGAPALLDPRPETFVPYLTLGAFLFFAGAALMWSAQDLEVRAPIVFWQGLVRLVAVISSLYAINAGLAETQLYGIVNRVIPSLKKGAKGEPSKEIEETGDYWLDEKSHSATLTEDGIRKVESMLNIDNLYDPKMLPVNHAISQALVAHTLKRLDVDYMVAVGESN